MKNIEVTRPEIFSRFDIDTEGKFMRNGTFGGIYFVGTVTIDNADECGEHGVYDYENEYGFILSPAEFE